MRSARISRYSDSTTWPVRTPSPPQQLHSAVDHLLGAFGGVQLGHCGLARDARPTRVLRPRRAVDEQRAGIDRQRHVGQARLHELEVAECLAKGAPLACVGHRLIERPPREAEGRRTHRGAEHVERA
jgi:hypothetical protein